MKLKNALLTLALGLSLSGAVASQVISYNPRSGDVWVDSQLGYMNDYGRSNRDYFADDIVNNFGAPRYLVNELLTERRWQPGDVYYACALAYQMHRPCGDVVKQYESNRGQGWGVIAQRMGIKPGSAQFHALKGQVGKSNGKFKSNGNGSGNSGKHGNNDGATYHDDGDMKGKGNSDKGKSGKGKSDKGDSDKGKGNSDAGSGNSGKSKGNGKS